MATAFRFSNASKCERHIANVTLFFRRGSPLSNFFPCTFTYHNVLYHTSEHFYHSEKCLLTGDWDTYSLIMATQDPDKMKKK